MNTNKPKKITVVVIMILTLLSLQILMECKDSSPGHDDPRVDHSIEMFLDYHKNWVKGLKQNIKRQGITKAIDNCNILESKTAQAIKKDRNIQIRRISSRPRNPQNAPDAYEIKIIEQWKKQLRSGVTPDIHTQETKTGLRVMRPIFVDGFCLQCHGTKNDVATAAAIKIAKMYPNDKAMNYKLHELRGAFTIIWKK